MNSETKSDAKSDTKTVEDDVDVSLKEETKKKTEQRSILMQDTGKRWDLLASNGGLGEYPKPKPFKPSKEYDPPTLFEIEKVSPCTSVEPPRNPAPWQRGIPIVSPLSSYEGNINAAEDTNAKVSPTTFSQKKSSGHNTQRYAQILRHQIDLMSGRRNKQTRKLLMNPSKNHYKD